MTANDTIKINNVAFVCESIERGNHGAFAVLAKRGKRGGLLKTRWLVRLKAGEPVGRVSKWF